MISKQMFSNMNCIPFANRLLGSKSFVTNNVSKDVPHVGHAKSQPKKGYFFQSSSAAIPHPSKQEIRVDLTKFGVDDKKFKENEPQGVGEDSFFTLKNALAVADGVGGWGLIENGNSAAYSRLFSHNLMKRIKGISTNKLSEETLRTTISEAQTDTNAEKILGSTTLCVCLLKENTLLAANVGDSGFMLVRDGTIKVQSREQLLGFNTPNQLGPNPSDTSRYDFYRLEVQEGDYIIAYTDGVSDNLFTWEILKAVTDNKDPKKIAEQIMHMAHEESLSTRVSPFEMSARKAKMLFQGGKSDDISVVVGRVKSLGPNPFLTI